MAAYPILWMLGLPPTASMFDRGVDDYMLEAAMIKVFASEAVGIPMKPYRFGGGKAFFCDQPLEDDKRCKAEFHRGRSP